MGYEIDDAEEIYNTISNQAKKAFINSQYILEVLNIYGQKLSIDVEIYGKKQKSGKVYNFKTGWTAYPNGKLHNNTPFGGWVKKRSK